MKKVILVFGIFLLAACSSKEGDKKAQLEKLKAEQAKLSDQILAIEKELAAQDTTVKRKETVVAITEVQPKSFKHFVEVQGKVDAEENVTISAQMPGTIDKIYVKAGEVVRKGQLLASLDNGVTAQGIQELQSALTFANNIYNKQKNLWDQKIGSEIQYLTAKNNKESLERKLATLNEQSDMSNIKSPVNGTVDEVMLKLGQTVAPGLPAVRVVNTSSLTAKAEISESYGSRIFKGNDVTVQFPDINYSVDTKVDFAGKAINPLTRTFNVEVKLDNNNPELRPNMLAVLKIVDYSNNEALVVPVNTVQNSEEGQYVMIVDKQNGKLVAKKQAVTTGHVYNGMAEIKKGISKGDKIITTGYQDLDNGSIIKF